MIQRIVLALLFGFLGLVAAAVVAFILVAVANQLGQVAAGIVAAAGATGVVGSLLVDFEEEGE